MKYLKSLALILKNKYLLSLTAFVVWMLFFDRNDLFTQLEWRSDLRELQESKAFFTKRIEEDRKFSRDLQYDATTIEKYAREKYLMKRDNEELFLVEPLKNK